MAIEISGAVKRRVVRMVYRYRCERGNVAAGDAYESGFLDALWQLGATSDYMDRLEDELADMFYSYVEGEWK